MAKRLSSGQWLRDLKAVAASYKASIAAAFDKGRTPVEPAAPASQPTAPTQDL